MLPRHIHARECSASMLGREKQRKQVRPFFRMRVHIYNLAVGVNRHVYPLNPLNSERLGIFCPACFHSWVSKL